MSKEPTIQQTDKPISGGQPPEPKRTQNKPKIEYKVYKELLSKTVDEIVKLENKKPVALALQNNSAQTVSALKKLGPADFNERVTGLTSGLKEQAKTALFGKSITLPEPFITAIDQSGVLTDHKNANGANLTAADIPPDILLSHLYEGIRQHVISDEYTRLERVHRDANSKAYDQNFSNSLTIAPPDSSEKDKSPAFKDGAKSLYDFTGGRFQCTETKAQFSVSTNGTVQGTSNWNKAAALTFAKVTMDQARRLRWDPTNLNGTQGQLKSICKALLQEGMNSPISINKESLKSFDKSSREELLTYQAIINNTPARDISIPVSDAAACLANIQQFEPKIDLNNALKVLVSNKAELINPQAQAALYQLVSKDPLNISAKDFIKAMPDQTKKHTAALIKQDQHAPSDKTQNTQEDDAKKKLDDPQNGPNTPSR